MSLHITTLFFFASSLRASIRANNVHVQVLNGTLLNVALFAHEPSEFPNADTMTVPTTRDEIIQVTAGLSPHIGEISRLFPEKSVKWGIYDMFDNPAPDFTRGSVCIAGDAAHASSPYQGAGACMGVEDALVLCEVLEAAQSILSETSLRKNEHGGVETSTSDSLVVKQALRAYSMERMERSQWLVQSSREMGDMYQWRHGPTGRDTDQCRNKLAHASRKLWDFDVDRMIVGVREKAHTQAL
jgi:salicylate hydroxylase